MTKRISGLLTALATPFNQQDEIDFQMLKVLTERSIDAGIDAVVAGGGTGEFAWLSQSERIEIFNKVVEFSSGRVPVIANCGAMTAKEATLLSNAAIKAGADVVMLGIPYYDPLSFREIKNYVKSVADAIDVPVMYYNSPGTTGVNLNADQLGELGREITNLEYVKDSSGDYQQALQLIRYHSDHIGFITGWDSFMFAAILEGATGAMLGTANVVPHELAAVYRELKAGNIPAARKAWERVFPVIDTMLSIPFIQGVKAGLELQGIPVGQPRKPLMELPESDRKVLAQALNQMKATS